MKNLVLTGNLVGISPIFDHYPTGAVAIFANGDFEGDLFIGISNSENIIEHFDLINLGNIIQVDEDITLRRGDPNVGAICLSSSEYLIMEAEEIPGYIKSNISIFEKFPTYSMSICLSDWTPKIIVDNIAYILGADANVKHIYNMAIYNIIRPLIKIKLNDSIGSLFRLELDSKVLKFVPLREMDNKLRGDIQQLIGEIWAELLGKYGSIGDFEEINIWLNTERVETKMEILASMSVIIRQPDRILYSRNKEQWIHIRDGVIVSTSEIFAPIAEKICGTPIEGIYSSYIAENEALCILGHIQGVYTIIDKNGLVKSKPTTSKIRNAITKVTIVDRNNDNILATTDEGDFFLISRNNNIYSTKLMKNVYQFKIFDILYVKELNYAILAGNTQKLYVVDIKDGNIVQEIYPNVGPWVWKFDTKGLGIYVSGYFGWNPLRAELIYDGKKFFSRNI